MKWFHCDKNDNNDDFMQMETTNKSGKEEIPSRTEAFVTLEKGLGWFEMEKERNSMQFLALK